MPVTPQERRALAGLAAIAALGTGSAVVRQWTSRHADTPASRAALRAQLVAVDSAQAASRRPRSGGSRARRMRPGRVARSGAAAAPPAPVAPASPPAPVDLDTADSLALLGLPRIGPALAGRILADRAARGPFGSLQALERVRGIGPAMAKALTPHVRFSGGPWSRSGR